MFQEQFKSLGEAYQLSAVHIKRCNLGTSVVNKFHNVVFWTAGDWGRRAVRNLVQLAEDVAPVTEHGAVHGGQARPAGDHGGRRGRLRAAVAQGRGRPTLGRHHSLGLGMQMFHFG